MRTRRWRTGPGTMREMEIWAAQHVLSEWQPVPPPQAAGTAFTPAARPISSSLDFFVSRSETASHQQPGPERRTTDAGMPHRQAGSASLRVGRNGRGLPVSDKSGPMPKGVKYGKRMHIYVTEKRRKASVKPNVLPHRWFEVSEWCSKFPWSRRSANRTARRSNDVSWLELLTDLALSSGIRCTRSSMSAWPSLGVRALFLRHAIRLVL